MKYLVIISIMFISSCQVPTGNHEYDNYKVSNEYTTINTISGHRVYLSTFEYDSCEYIIIGEGNKIAMTHKGNCKFCKERNKHK